MPKGKKTASRAKPKATTGASPAQVNRKDMAKYQAQDDLRTLSRAQEIETDAKRLKAAQTEARKQAKAASVVANKSPRKG